MVLALLLALLVGLGVVQFWQMVLILALARVSVTFELPSRQVFFFDLVGKETCPTRSPSTRACSTRRGSSARRFGAGPRRARRDRLLHAQRRELPGGDRRGLLHPAAQDGEVRAAAGPRRQGVPGRLVLHRPRPTDAGALPADDVLRLRRHGLRGDDPRVHPPDRGRGRRGVQPDAGVRRPGATAGALAVAKLGRIERKELLVIAGISVFSASLAAAAFFPTGSPPAGRSQSGWLAASACLLGAGFGASLFYSATQTVVQLTVPQHLRGRVMGVWMIVFSGSVPLGALWTGRRRAALGGDARHVLLGPGLRRHGPAGPGQRCPEAGRETSPDPCSPASRAGDRAAAGLRLSSRSLRRSRVDRPQHAVHRGDDVFLDRSDQTVGWP